MYGHSGPVPPPKRAELGASSAVPQPSSRHTTAASRSSQPSWQTALHVPPE